MYLALACARCQETTSQNILASALKEPTILFGDGVRVSKVKHHRDLLGTSWDLMLAALLIFS